MKGRNEMRMNVAIFCTLFIALLISGTFFFLYRYEKNKFFLLFSIGWGLHFSQFIFLFLSKSMYQLDGFGISAYIFTILSSIVIFNSKNYESIDTRKNLIIFLVGVGCIFWIIVSAIVNIPFTMSIIPVFFYTGILFISMGNIIIKEKIFSKGSLVVGIIIIIWGLYRFSFIFLESSFFYMSLRFMISQFFSVGIVLAIILSECVIAKNHIKKLYESYKGYIVNNNCILIILDKDTNKIIDVSQAALEFYDYSRHEMLGENFSKIVHNNTHEKHLKSCEVVQTIHRTKKGVEKDVVVHTNIMEQNGKQLYFNIIFDITEKIIAEKKVDFLTHYDLTTKIPNKTAFYQDMNNLDKEKSFPLSIIYTDINGLRKINETYGYNIGNQIIEKIAKITEDFFKDIGKTYFVSSNTFAIITKLTEYEVSQYVSSYRELIKQIDLIDKDITISFGLASKKHAKDKSQDLLQLAEKRMYKNKLIERESLRHNILHPLIIALQEKTIETEQHINRVKEISVRIAQKMYLKHHKINDVLLTAMLHDIGKIAVPEEVLNKSGVLSTHEWMLMKNHSEIGFRIVSSLLDLEDVALNIRAHHERWDGTGYPDGLAKTDIPIAARIVSVADAFDAMITERCYKETLSENEALEEIMRCSGTQFDPDIVNIFLQIYKDTRSLI